MRVRDVDGSAFDSSDIENVLECFDDPVQGQLASVRLTDGSVRTVRSSELEIAARDDFAGSSFANHWPSPPSH